MISRFLMLVMVFASAGAQAQGPGQGLVGQARDLVETQRRILALHQEAASASATADGEARTRAGQYLFHGTQQKSTALAQVLAEAARRGDTAALNAFFDYLERGDLYDADRLALREAIEEWAAGTVPPAARERVARLQADMQRTQARYARELEAAMAAQPMRGLDARRAGWDEYLGVLRDKYPVQDLSLIHI